MDGGHVHWDSYKQLELRVKFFSKKFDIDGEKLKALFKNTTSDLTSRCQRGCSPQYIQFEAAFNLTFDQYLEITAGEEGRQYIVGKSGDMTAIKPSLFFGDIFHVYVDTTATHEGGVRVSRDAEENMDADKSVKNVTLSAVDVNNFTTDPADVKDFVKDPVDVNHNATVPVDVSHNDTVHDDGDDDATAPDDVNDVALYVVVYGEFFLSTSYVFLVFNLSM